MTPAALLAAVAGVLAASGLIEFLAASDRRRPGARRATAADRGDGRGGDASGRPRSSAAPRATAPAAASLIAMLAGVGRRLPARPPSGMGRRVDAAGLDAAVAEPMALKAGTAVAGLALAVAVGSGTPGRLGWLLLLGGPLLGFLAPDAWLRRRTHHRRRVMEEQLGDVLELLRVGVEAGLTVPRALGEVGRRHPGLLAREIRRTAGLLELGVPQRHALEELVRRCPAAGVATLAASLGRAERHGAPLGDALAAQAEDARARRARSSIELAARAAPKIQLIVALLLVPSAMLLMAAAMLPALAWR